MKRDAGVKAVFLLRKKTNGRYTFTICWCQCDIQMNLKSIHLLETQIRKIHEITLTLFGKGFETIISTKALLIVTR